MSIRYLSYLSLALLAGFVVVATQAFPAFTAGWIAFGIGIAFAVVAAAMSTRRGLIHRGIYGAISTLGVLIIIESVIASGSVMLALSLAGGLGVLALAVTGLVLHELSSERVVHSLQIAPAESRSERPVAA